jgi:anti-anti-sigma regulatory factor
MLQDTQAMPDTLALPAELTIYTVGEWSARCLGWIGPEDPLDGALRVDASAVAEADAAGVQLLISLANGLARCDRRLVLAGASRPLAHAATTLGAEFLLADAPTTESQP